jgi:hypothetical protein
MNPELQLYSYNYINMAISNLSDISECDRPAKAIDWYEKQNPSDRANIQDMRDVLCDKTFELFIKKYPKK